ncbi:type II toxin-antitoxin system Phd/YefM family antitoxin [Lacticaseibacillus yichunensis]|uniref:Antitoxin n=1 Tax=Lacticaseibacillus yichunensis TaxID=2486015 RepID=A0ABW4CNF1_9LACO|nr:type II toxin-antitoxin system Phd/YefM family antitoxin [Lacticaseibacillus yichunensis]
MEKKEGGLDAFFDWQKTVGNAQKIWDIWAAAPKGGDTHECRFVVQLSPQPQSLYEKSNRRREPLIVTAKHPGDNIVLMSQQEYDSLKETLSLLSSLANSKALRKSIRQATDEAN